MSKKRSSDKTEDEVKETVQELTKVQLYGYLVNPGSPFTLVDGDMPDGYWCSLMWGHKTSPTNIAHFEATIHVDGFSVHCKFPLRVYEHEWQCTGLGFKLALQDDSVNVFRIIDSKDTTLSNDCSKQHKITVINIVNIVSEEIAKTPFVIKRRLIRHPSNTHDVDDGNDELHLFDEEESVQKVPGRCDDDSLDIAISMLTTSHLFQQQLQDNIIGSVVTQLFKTPGFKRLVMDTAIAILKNDLDFRLEVERRARQEIKNGLLLNPSLMHDDQESSRIIKRQNIEELISKAKQRKLVIPTISLKK